MAAVTDDAHNRSVDLFPITAEGYAMKKSIGTIGVVLGLFAPLAVWADHTIDESSLAQFKRVDVDGSGYLSETEVTTTTSATRGLSVSQYGGFELADVNDDDQLSPAEFAAFEEEIPAE
ncbi:MAG: hypothetical protein PVH86_11845 [Thiogranum sp.]